MIDGLTSPLVIATHNEGKRREVEALLAPFDLDIRMAGALGLPEPEETGMTFIENARIKAIAAAKASRHMALADDSGLEVLALAGAPGVYSARWAGPEKDFALAMRRVEEALRAKDVNPTGQLARFVCVLCLADPEGRTLEFTGTVEGALTFPPRGDGGFGYDPIFVPVGHGCTFAEMEAGEKHRISHRARAFDALLRRFGIPPRSAQAL